MAVDAAVGTQVMQVRNSAGVSIAACANKLGMLVQYFEEHETGERRFTGRDLFELAHLLTVPIFAFFNTIDLGPLPLKDLVILLMEEDEEERERFSVQLEKLGAGVVAVDSLQQARIALNQFSFTIVVCSAPPTGGSISSLVRKSQLDTIPVIFRVSQISGSPNPPLQFEIQRSFGIEGVVSMLKGIICQFVS